MCLHERQDLAILIKHSQIYLHSAKRFELGAINPIHFNLI
jgi:hypothetical protein